VVNPAPPARFVNVIPKPFTAVRPGMVIMSVAATPVTEPYAATWPVRETAVQSSYFAKIPLVLRVR